jgi:uridine phosphorylase
MEARFTGKMAVDYLLSREGITLQDMHVAPIIVVTWGRKLVQKLAISTGAKLCEHWFYGDRNPLYTGKISDREVSFLQAPVGAPGTVMIMEELAACGAHTFLGLGWAGSLQPDLPVGSILIPSYCIREEGTSLHYMSPDVRVETDAGLAMLFLRTAIEHGVNSQMGTHWTIDAPYRELTWKIEKYRQEGVLGVDMETSAMAAFGLYYGLRVCNLLVVSDELWNQWKPAFRTDELERANLKAQEVLFKCIERIPLA